MRLRLRAILTGLPDCPGKPGTVAWSCASADQSESSFCEDWRSPHARRDRQPVANSVPSTSHSPNHATGTRSACCSCSSRSAPDPECRAFYGYEAVLRGHSDGWVPRAPERPVVPPWSFREQSGETVIDKTGLTGVWDVDIKWDPGPALSGAPGGGADIDFGSIFTAVRERLGLKLQPTNAGVEALVIERVQRPSPN